MSGAPRILEVLFAPTWGGMEMLAFEFARAFQDRSRPVTVCALPNSPLAEHAEQAHLPVEMVRPRWTYLDFLTAGELARIIRVAEIDLIHAHRSADLSTLALAIQLAQRGRLVLTQHMDFHRSKRDLFHRWVYRRVAQVVTLTEEMRNNHLHYTPAHPDQVTTIYNGVRLPQAAGDIAAARRSLSLDRDDLVIGVVGRLDRTKRQDLLLDAAAEICGDFTNLRILIAGAEAPTPAGAGYEAALRQQAQHLGITDRCRFVGFIDDRDTIMQAIDILAHPTPSESFGLVLAEAMAHAKPVVASRAGGAPEVVEDEVTGYLFNPLDVAELTTVLRRLCGDAELRNTMGRAGRERVERLFTFDRMVDEYETLFCRVMECDA